LSALQQEVLISIQCSPTKKVHVNKYSTLSVACKTALFLYCTLDLRVLIASLSHVK